MLQKYKKGDIIFKEGSEVANIYVIKKGKVNTFIKDKNIVEIHAVIMLIKSLLNYNFTNEENLYPPLKNDFTFLSPLFSRKPDTSLSILSFNEGETLGSEFLFFGVNFLYSAIVESEEAQILIWKKEDYENYILKERKKENVGKVKTIDLEMERKMKLIMDSLIRVNRERIRRLDDEYSRKGRSVIKECEENEKLLTAQSIFYERSENLQNQIQNAVKQTNTKISNFPEIKKIFLKRIKKHIKNESNINYFLNNHNKFVIDKGRKSNSVRLSKLSKKFDTNSISFNFENKSLLKNTVDKRRINFKPSKPIRIIKIKGNSCSSLLPSLNFPLKTPKTSEKSLNLSVSRKSKFIQINQNNNNSNESKKFRFNKLFITRLFGKDLTEFEPYKNEYHIENANEYKKIYSKFFKYNHTMTKLANQKVLRYSIFDYYYKENKDNNKIGFCKYNNPDNEKDIIFQLNDRDIADKGGINENDSVVTIFNLKPK